MVVKKCTSAGNIRAATRAFQYCDILTSVDSDEHAQPPLKLVGD